jgi:UPF0716 family protein affecting phage T7 exclusion
MRRFVCTVSIFVLILSGIAGLVLGATSGSYPCVWWHSRWTDGFPNQRESLITHVFMQVGPAFILIGVVSGCIALLAAVVRGLWQASAGICSKLAKRVEAEGEKDG